MRETVTHTIAEFMEANYEEVAHWDRNLINYFVHHPGRFEEFRQGRDHARSIVWMQAVRVVASMA